MKNALLVIFFLMMLSAAARAQESDSMKVTDNEITEQYDILTLKNTSEYEGEVIRTLYNCKILVFKTNKTKYFIPTKDISSICFSNTQNPVFQQFVKERKFIKINNNNLVRATNTELINNYRDLECYRKIDKSLLSLYPSNWKELALYSIFVHIKMHFN